MRDREGLSTARDAEQGLEPAPLFEPPSQRLDGLGLVALRLEVAPDPKASLHGTKKVIAFLGKVPIQDHAIQQKLCG
jgi:hypothetical protein